MRVCPLYGASADKICLECRPLPTVEKLLTLVASNSRKQYRDTLHLSGVIPGSGRMLLKNLGGLEI